MLPGSRTATRVANRSIADATTVAARYPHSHRLAQIGHKSTDAIAHKSTRTPSASPPACDPPISNPRTDAMASERRRPRKLLPLATIVDGRKESVVTSFKTLRLHFGSNAGLWYINVLNMGHMCSSPVVVNSCVAKKTGGDEGSVDAGDYLTLCR